MFVVIALNLVFSTAAMNDDNYQKIVDAHASYEMKLSNVSFTANAASSDDNLNNIDFMISLFGKSCKIRSVRDIVNSAPKFKNKAVEGISSVNDAYSFSLRKKNTDSNYVVISQTKDIQSARQAIIRNLWRHIKSPTMIRGREVTAMLKDKDCTVTKTASADGSVVLDVTFNCSKESDNEEDVSFVGKVHLNSNSLIEKYDLTLQFLVDGKKFQRRQVFTVKYQPDSTNPASTKNEIFDLENKGTSIDAFREEWHVSDVKTSTNDASMFTLPHYGFPEPPWLLSGKESIVHTIPWFLVISIAGIACLVVASFLLYRKGTQTV